MGLLLWQRRNTAQYLIRRPRALLILPEFCVSVETVEQGRTTTLPVDLHCDIGGLHDLRLVVMNGQGKKSGTCVVALHSGDVPIVSRFI